MKKIKYKVGVDHKSINETCQGCTIRPCVFDSITTAVHCTQLHPKCLHLFPRKVTLVDYILQMKSNQ